MQDKTANGSIISFTYDGVGNIKTVTDGRGTSSYNYYENNQLRNETLPNNKVIQYEYNNNGSRTKITDPFNLAVNYQYDNLERLDTVTVDGKIFRHEYYDDGTLKAIIYPALTNGQVLRAEFAYDKGNRLTNVTNKIGPRVISQYGYTHDNQGNILSKQMVL